MVQFHIDLWLLGIVNMDTDPQPISRTVGRNPKMPQTTGSFGIEQDELLALFLYIAMRHLPVRLERGRRAQKRHGLIADHARVG